MLAKAPSKWALALVAVGLTSAVGVSMAVPAPSMSREMSEFCSVMMQEGAMDPSQCAQMMGQEGGGMAETCRRAMAGSPEDMSKACRDMMQDGSMMDHCSKMMGNGGGMIGMMRGGRMGMMRGMMG